MRSQSLRRVFLSAFLTSASAYAGGPFSLNPPRYEANGLRFALTGYAQGELHAFPNWDADGAGVGEAAQIRRARIGVAAGWRRLTFESDIDLKAPDERIRNGWLQFQANPKLAFRLGYFKLPMGLEYQTGVPNIDFLERARVASVLFQGRDLGGMVFGRVGERFRYQAGVFAGDTLNDAQRAHTTVAARAVVSSLGGLDLGGSFSVSEVRAGEDRKHEPVDEPIAKGVQGRTPLRFVFADRQLVNGTRTRQAIEATYWRGPYSVKGEFGRFIEERKGLGCAVSGRCADLPSLVSTGWTVSASWLVTGEKKGPTRLVPNRPVSQGGPGAIEFALRAERLRVDHGSAPEDARQPVELILAGGVSWWPSRWFRFSGNLFLEHFDQPLSAPEPGRKGNYVSLLARLELHVP